MPSWSARSASWPTISRCSSTSTSRPGGGRGVPVSPTRAHRVAQRRPGVRSAWCWPTCIAADDPARVAARRVVVVGGGISGLAAAWELTGAAEPAAGAPEVVVLEASGAFGGKLRSDRSADRPWTRPRRVLGAAARGGATVPGGAGCDDRRSRSGPRGRRCGPRAGARPARRPGPWGFPPGSGRSPGRASWVCWIRCAGRDALLPARTGGVPWRPAIGPLVAEEAGPPGGGRAGRPADRRHPRRRRWTTCPPPRSSPRCWPPPSAGAA